MTRVVSMEIFVNLRALLFRSTRPFDYCVMSRQILPVHPKSSKSKEPVMKHVLVIVAAIIIALSSQAVARLGNTEEQVNVALGKPTDPGKPDINGVTTNLYKNPTGEYIAVIQFLNGHSVAEAYSRVDSHDLSQKEVSVFLGVNSLGNKWEKKQGAKATWIRSDHKAHARYETVSGRPTLMIQADH